MKAENRVVGGLSSSGAIALLLVGAILLGSPLPAQSPVPSSRLLPAKDRLAGLANKAQIEGKVRVIVGLDVAFTPEGRLDARSVTGQREAIEAAQNSLMSSLAGTGALLLAKFEFIPYVALEVDAGVLAKLAALPAVIAIEEDVAVPPTLASSNPVIGSPNAWAAGFAGSGQVVAILDTGVDKTHPFFTTGHAKVVSEACYSTTSSTSVSVCPGGVSSSTASGSGVNCSLSVTGCNHGTHVAGIAAGNNGAGPNFGVAREADVVAIQVFSRFNSPSSCGSAPAPCVLAFFTDQIKGLERVFALRATFSIAAANMSLGGGRFFDPASCDSANSGVKAAIDNLRSVQIATVISAGNDGFRDSMGAPGCISTAVSVGATDDSDNVASFSNVASFLDLLAPGVSINSSVPGGGIATFNGTSMAAPHVTGAWAILKQANPGATVDEVLAALRSSGTFVDDERSGGSVTGMRRINVDDALDSPGGGATVLLVDDDDNAPDVRPYYTAALNALGVDYEVWNTQNSDVEPSAAVLDAYSNIVWFTGDSFGGAAGPGASGEAALSTYLNGRGCLLISSQDYFFDRGITSFMSTYLGVDSVSNDIDQASVTGQGQFFGALGTQTLAYPFNNFSDRISPNASAEVAFLGNVGHAGVKKNTGIYRTAYFGFPFEALPSASVRQQTMNADLQFCDTVFGDVPPGYWAKKWVEAIFNFGITSGCSANPRMFCPESLVTRDQMAIFLLIAKEGSGYTPPPCTSSSFSDVPTSSPFCPWIKELANRGVTSGCGGGRFCPGSQVTRDQMAVFLLATKEGAGYTPPACGATSPFSDVPVSSPFCRWVREMANRGITGGCGGGNFCPSSPVSRAQMAVFLVTTFGLPLP
jgi:subtilisin family serine protease